MMAKRQTTNTTRSKALRNWFLRLAALTASAALCFALMEAGVRLFVDMARFKPISVHDVDPDNPLAFIPGRTHIYETSEYRYEASYNRFGRRDSEWPQSVVDDPEGILFIGDSFTFGNAVANEHSLPSRLEASLAESGRTIEVLNFGMPAGAPPQYHEMLKHALEAGFAARTILIGTFVGNDFYRSALAPPKLILRALAESASGSKVGRSRPFWRSDLVRLVRARIGGSPLLVGWILRAGQWLGVSVYDTAGSFIFLRNPTDEQQATFDKILASFGAMDELARRWQRDLRVVVIPNKLQVENASELEGRTFDSRRPNRLILEYCRDQGIACLDLLPILRAHYRESGEALYYPIDRHFNPAGTALAGRSIADFLNEMTVDTEGESEARQ